MILYLIQNYNYYLPRTGIICNYGPHKTSLLLKNDICSDIFKVLWFLILTFSFQDDIHNSVNYSHEMLSIQLNKFVIPYTMFILYGLIFFPLTLQYLQPCQFYLLLIHCLFSYIEKSSLQNETYLPSSLLKS